MKKQERLYRIWHSMKQRCSNKNLPFYKYYGGKGVTVCMEWQKYKPFHEWALKNGYKEDLTIDRIDLNSGYCPENCRWIPFAEQRANTTQTRQITINGITKPLKHWCIDYGISYQAVCQRIHRGMDDVSALLTPIRRG
jgi:hypothetical protein